jgi:hypothetical protein
MQKTSAISRRQKTAGMVGGILMGNMEYGAYLRTFILGAGVVSSWSALIAQFRNFLGAYGTLMHASTTTFSNPLLTPCLYGSLAFLVALVWSTALHIYPNQASEKWLGRLLLFGIVFAVVVVSYDCADYFGLIRFGALFVCTPGVNPLYTACFRGLLFFIAAYAAGWWQQRVRTHAHVDK